ncbi:MAG: hypothetical protein HFI23_01155 [Lachnospiraceae bacterium]|uniref:hypothetical protein n=1 Tax=Candidatus Merdisoma sp. JLR.KK011 TaxID=3114299 RepID=UPI0029D6A971|nr:hypothetical protein [Lachnospiraceae bacterium]
MERLYQLILNPVENIPKLFQIHIDEFTKGLYISDKYKDDEINKQSKIAFSGRSEYSDKIRIIYNEWAKQLGAKSLSMRLLSGLHAHIVLFMGLGKIGDTILLLPESAGGHYATKKILERLGYNVLEMIPDNINYCVDIDKTKEIIYQREPQLIFVDRSEGIYYEDFSKLLDNIPDNCGTIFDASQYLTNILEKDFKSPFSMGFDILMSTLHKNFPGPQKALVCSKDDNIYWERIMDAVSSYVSNLHAENIFVAGQILKFQDILKTYSNRMLNNSIQLEKKMLEEGIPVIKRASNRIATHHIWIKPDNMEQAYHFYKKAEQCGILFNYRKLPYDLGYGIRMGTSAATLQGLNEQNLPELAKIISDIYYQTEISDSLLKRVQDYIKFLSPLNQ